MIAAGRVSVDGRVVTSLGTKVDPAREAVAVDGRVVEPLTEPAYFALHKPRGYVTTMHDPQGRPTVAEFLPDSPAGLVAVGRLDMDTEGLLIVTNDGDLAHRLMHPRHHVEKEYLAVVGGVPTDDELRRLREGIELDDGPGPARRGDAGGRGGNDRARGRRRVRGAEAPGAAHVRRRSGIPWSRCGGYESGRSSWETRLPGRCAP